MSEHHIVKPKTYVTILCCLFVLMALTVGAGKVHIGPHDVHVYNLLIALFIAFCKMSLILMFFMHVKYGTNMTRVFAMGGFCWLVIFFTLLLADYMSRHWDSPFVISPYGG